MDFKYYDKKFLENKKIILEKIEQGKQAGINKVSAVFAINENDEMKNKMVKEIATWLMEDGYKISLKEDELKILVIEWD
ncbi:hypothetical protein FDB55_00980 [Clostridium botulinum]|uniref:Uncharacterized protein n=2 Tax=Clostridium botulinum TaxID=1491 RepID=B2TJ95_CLOBB|nr:MULTISPECIES: hypothetical protein [Clostridium]ACD24515.1 hypothetical protein CLL_A1313 [Clostridium botulinum B str. Eklund 17B (NRP)]AIY81904.1 hypothetical protein U728_19 [Clostridium botulinum 202F]ACD51085.1 hypothetical protein CLH_1261 [Clostridium botulinum E3 str. Alaska E43]AJF29271.1 hypothetical protein ST13_06080 [Clostridium botulinum]AJF32332.1 hypothetical protein ST12_06080 [Clostridium botulinum]